jgi:lipid II:glycine glycyltransferase (peptidoglycan interpeptide bridge formation enzyme)
MTIENRTNSIFQTNWWLEALAPGQWGEVTFHKGDEIVARLPYVKKIKWGLTILTSPPLTQTLGPWLIPSHAKYAKQLSQEKELFGTLIERLPPFDLFRQNFSPAITNWLPFYWAEFQQNTRYTYRLENLIDHDQLWFGFQENIRREIRKAMKLVEVCDDSASELGLDQFLDINEKSFQRQGKSLPYSRDLVNRLDKACIKHDARRIFFARDAKGRIHSTVYIVWDNNTAYYLMGGRDPELHNSGATSLVMWEAIKFASSVSKQFDFEGSMIETIEKFFRAFGAKQVPYFHVTKASPRMKVLLAGRDLALSLYRYGK